MGSSSTDWPPGETLEPVNDHRPSSLHYELEATRPGQYQWVDGDNGPETWTAAITCTARIVDLRPILARGEEPFDTIMANVGELEADQPLVVLVLFESVPLEGVLSAEGFTWSAETLDSCDWRSCSRPRDDRGTHRSGRAAHRQRTRRRVGAAVDPERLSAAAASRLSDDAAGRLGVRR